MYIYGAVFFSLLKHAEGASIQAIQQAQMTIHFKKNQEVGSLLQGFISQVESRVLVLS